MAKLTKVQTKAHNKAMDLLHSDRKLSVDDVFFFYENYREDANHNIAWNKAYFTPIDLARDFFVGCGNIDGKMIDLCAGIGKLSYFFYINKKDKSDITCVELNSSYCNIGKRLMPDANWINGSILDLNIPDIKEYELAISNPPFGNPYAEIPDNFIFKNKNVFELVAVELATKLANRAAFILPSNVVPFEYSGKQQYSKVTNAKYEKFNKLTNIDLDILFSVDCNVYKDMWNSCKPNVEMVEWVNDDYNIKVG